MYNSNKIKRLVKNGKAKIAIYGLGHVGAALAAVWIRAGATVIGVDRSESVVDQANKGLSQTLEPGVKEAFRKGIKRGKFSATLDSISASQNSQIKFVTVPVMLSNGHADFSAINDVTSKIAKGLKKGDIISINSSVPPGTTEEVVLPNLQASELKVEEDFALIYSPERVYEGRAIEDIEENYPAIVSGIGEKSTKIGAALYSLVAKKGVITMSNVKAAEIEKLLEGVYRDVNIALANEIAKLCEKYGLDFWEVRSAANSQPYCNLHKPGAGVGGACIPIYPQFVIELADKLKAGCDITKLAREVNLSMPKHCVNEALELLQGKGKSVNDSNIAVLGLAFRGGVSDTRLSPTYQVLEEFLRFGCRVSLHDPYVHNYEGIPSSVILTNKLEQVLNNADLVFIATDHPQYAKFSKKTLLKLAKKDAVVYDGRGILDPKRFDSMQFTGIGRKGV